MYNMSYCKLENTYGALKECMDVGVESLSEGEKHYFVKLTALCQEFAEACADSAEVIANETGNQ
jgi:hypothetical protein